MWHAWGRVVMHTGICRENLKERDHLEELGVNGILTVKWISKKWDGEAWTGSIWLRIGVGGGLL
jgi:hypothetical protein